MFISSVYSLLSRRKNNRNPKRKWYSSPSSVLRLMIWEKLLLLFNFNPIGYFPTKSKFFRSKYLIRNGTIDLQTDRYGYGAGPGVGPVTSDKNEKRPALRLCLLQNEEFESTLNLSWFYFLTLRLPRGLKNGEHYLTVCKILQNNQCYGKVLVIKFYLDSHTLGNGRLAF